MDDRKHSGSLLPGDECWSSAFSLPPEGQGIDGHIFAMTGFHGTLVAGGEFTLAGGRSVRNVAGWDGTTWTPWDESSQEESSASASMKASLLQEEGCGQAMTLSWALSAPGMAWNGSGWAVGLIER
jgi:hypothetical protein